MKLRAIIKDIKAFIALFAVMKGSHKTCYLHFQPGRLRVIAGSPVADEGGAGAAGDSSSANRLWGTADTREIFYVRGFVIESHTDNHVVMELRDVSHMLFALRALEKNFSGPATPEVDIAPGSEDDKNIPLPDGPTMKLAQTDKDDASTQCLSIGCMSTGALSRAGKHDALHLIPVRVMDRSELAHLRAPNLPGEHVIHLQAGRVVTDLVAIIDRFKACKVSDVSLAFKTLDGKRGMLTVTGTTPGLQLNAFLSDVPVDLQSQEQAAKQRRQREEAAGGGGGAADSNEKMQQQQQQQLLGPWEGQVKIPLRRLSHLLQVREVNTQEQGFMLTRKHSLAMWARIRNMGLYLCGFASALVEPDTTDDF